jgi:hypothetical protein
MTEFAHSHAIVARHALFEAGLELAGVRLQLFAERLLAAADAWPEAPTDEIVRRAVHDIDDGALALVAEGPELRDRRLNSPAVTVAEAAETTLQAFGCALVQAHRRR